MYDVRFPFRTTKELLESLKRKAEKLNLSLNAYLNMILTKEIEK